MFFLLRMLWCLFALYLSLRQPQSNAQREEGREKEGKEEGGEERAGHFPL